MEVQVSPMEEDIDDGVRGPTKCSSPATQSQRTKKRVDKSETKESLVHRYMMSGNRKKQAAAEAQALLNRIALLKNEEERAIRSIDKAKERAVAIAALRDEQEKKVRQSLEQNKIKTIVREQTHEQNRKMDESIKKSLASKTQEVILSKREKANSVKTYRQIVNERIQEEEEKELIEKRKKRDEIRRQEIFQKQKRQQEIEQQRQRILSMYNEKVLKEEKEVREAEKLVKVLEEREYQHIIQLKQTKKMQEEIVDKLENFLNLSV